MRGGKLERLGDKVFQQIVFLQSLRAFKKPHPRRGHKGESAGVGVLEINIGPLLAIRDPSLPPSAAVGISRA